VAGNSEVRSIAEVRGSVGDVVASRSPRTLAHQSAFVKGVLLGILEQHQICSVRRPWHENRAVEGDGHRERDTLRPYHPRRSARELHTGRGETRGTAAQGWDRP